MTNDNRLIDQFTNLLIYQFTNLPIDPLTNHQVTLHQVDHV